MRRPIKFQRDPFVQIWLQKNPPAGTQLPAPHCTKAFRSQTIILAQGKVKPCSKEGQNDAQVVTAEHSIEWHWVLGQNSGLNSHPRHTWCAPLNLYKKQGPTSHCAPCKPYLQMSSYGVWKQQLVLSSRQARAAVGKGLLGSFGIPASWTSPWELAELGCKAPHQPLLSQQTKLKWEQTSVSAMLLQMFSKLRWTISLYPTEETSLKRKWDNSACQAEKPGLGASLLKISLPRPIWCVLLLQGIPQICWQLLSVSAGS